MPDWEARCMLLENENEELRERVIALEEQLGVHFHSPPFLELTGNEAQIFGLLMARDVVTKSLAMVTIYGNKPDGDEAEQKIIDVWVCKMRAKLKHFGLEIDTHWGQGYSFTPAMKKKARAIIAEHSASVAA